MNKRLLSTSHPTMPEDKSSMSISNEDSLFGSYYQMKVPFQLTLEYCSGTSDHDYYNFLIASQMGSYSFTNPYSECCYYYTSRPLHQHNFYEMMIILKGTVIQQIEDKEYTYPAGTCCFINRNLHHRENFIGETQLLFLNFSIDFMKELLFPSIPPLFENDTLPKENAIKIFIENDFSHENQKIYLDFFPNRFNENSVHFLHLITDKLLHELLFPHFGSTHMIMALLSSLFTHLTQDNYFHATEVMLDSSADFLLFCRIRNLLEDTNGRISRAELEHLLNYTGNYLNRIVKKNTGLCLFDYGMNFCLAQAKHLLKTTTKTICDISEELGFSNRTHFYRLFKEKYGMTPREYRNISK